MKAGVYGAAPRVVDRATSDELVITANEIRHMEYLAGPEQYGLELGQVFRDRMSLTEAFRAFRAGQLDLDDPNSPIKFAHPTQIADAVRQVPELANSTLLAIDDGVHPAVIVGVGPNVPYQGGHVREERIEERSRFEQQSGQGYGHDIDVELQPKQPQIIYHDGPYQGRDQEPQDGPDAWSDEPPPMPRGERREPQLAREPMGRGRDDFAGFGDDAIRMRPEDRPRKVDGRGKQADAPAEEAKKIGRVVLTENDHKELHDIAGKLRMSIDKLYGSLRAPNHVERLVARSKVQPGSIFARVKDAIMHRDAETKERLVTIDPKREDGQTMVVSFAPKGKSWLNLWSAALHGASLWPGAGGTVQALGGLATFLTGMVAAFLPFVKTEHTVNMLRTGIKHMGLGAIGFVGDYSLGVLGYAPRAAANVAMLGADLAQFAGSLKNDGQARVTRVSGKASPYQRISGIADTMANGIMSALHR